jgi:CheY-like chemotaxis protein
MNELLPGGTTIRSGPCILIVEDEFLVAEMLEQMLDDLGYNSVKVGRLPEAIDLAATTALDGAILDLNLAGAEVYPVADELHRRGIPFVFSTGSGPEGVRGDYRGWPTLSKPYREDDLQRILAAALPPRAVKG